MISLFILALTLLLFGYWGLETQSGRATFDEMDGLIPFFAGVIGGMFLLISLIWLTINRFRTGKFW
ncbi:MAG: hypothetical protein AAF468_07580 [Pseudomonadota bacterium]